MDKREIIVKGILGKLGLGVLTEFIRHRTGTNWWGLTNTVITPQVP
jgi:hypothetical protein